MAVTLKLSSSQSCDCKTLTLTDATGVYNVTTNPTGWGTPNIAFGDVLCAYLKVFLPDHVTYYYVDVTSIFTGATTVADLIFTLDMGDLGGAAGDKFDDGCYDVVYKVGTTADNPTLGDCSNGTLATSTVYIPIYCQVQCCIISKFSLVPNYYCCDTCDNDYVEYVFDLWLMLKALQNANVTVSYVEFEKALSQAEDLCYNKDCNCY